MIGSTCCHNCGQLAPYRSMHSRCQHCNSLLFDYPGQPSEQPLATRQELEALEDKAKYPYPAADPLGRVYTPPTLCKALCEHVAVFFGSTPAVVLEPGVGRGDFLPAIRSTWPLARVLAVDLDRDARGLVPGLDQWSPDAALCADFVTAAQFWDRLPLGKYGAPELVIGNPPFGKAVGLPLTIAFVMAALTLTQEARGLCSFLLPLPYFCGQEFDAVWRRRRPRVVARVKQRPWPERLREVVALTWDWDQSDDTTDVVDLEWP